tara:strand:- start:8419 stop:9858 length:1440 start_codon:yes stop_codon:yes gene_type:complete
MSLIFQSLTANKSYILLLFICIFSRYITTIFYFEDIDSLRFALSASDYNILESRPHFPGYPVYCFILQIVYCLINSVAIAFSFIGGVSIFIIIFFINKIIGLFVNEGKVFNFLIVIILFNPFMWLMGNRYMPDIFGLSLLISASYFFIKILKFNKNKDYVLLGILLALECGVRISFMPFFLPVLILFFKKGILLTFLSFSLVFLLWLFPLIHITGFENLLSVFQNDFNGHFYKWGGTILSSEVSASERFFNVFRFIFVDGFSFYEDGRNWITIINTFFLLNFFFILIYNFKKIRLYFLMNKELLIFSLCFVIYFVWIFLFQNINYKPRHILPFIPLFCFFISLSSSFFMKKRFKNLLLFILITPYLYISSIVNFQHKNPSAISQINQYFSKNSERKIVVFADALNIFYFNKSCNNTNIKYINSNSRTSVMTKNYIDAGYSLYSLVYLPEIRTNLVDELYFFHNPYVNRLWSDLTLYKYE